MDAVRIVLADDHPIFRNGLRTLLAAVPGFTVVAEAEDGEAAMAAIGQHHPDVAVLDLDMPKRDGFAVAEAIRTSDPSTAIAVLTMHRSERLVNRAFDLGVKGFVIKDSAINEIVECIRVIHAGEHYVSPRLSGLVLNRSRRVAALRDEKPGLDRLTKAEGVVLAMIGDQRTSKEIAEALCISVRTVDRHRANICAKLDLHGVNALTKFAIACRSSL